MSHARSLPDALMRGILDSIDSRIAVLDARGTIVAVSSAWERFNDVRIAAGFSPANVGDNYLELLDGLARGGHPGFADAAKAARRMIARKAGHAEVDYRIEVPGGARWFVVRISPLEALDGVVVVAHTDVTERVQARLELEQANQRLKALSSQVISIQEEERRAISRELHDDVGQSLAALGLALHRMASRGVDAQVLATCNAIVDSTIEQVRRISHDLRPPQLESLGLGDALRWLAERHARATGVPISCDVAGAEGVRAEPALEIACYRIAQEAINNATRHAAPRSIALRLARSARALELSVRDDGAGFDLASERARALREGSCGLVGMEERASLAGGRVEFRSRRGAGTTVTARFPLESA